MVSFHFRLFLTILTLVLAQSSAFPLILVGGEGPIHDPGWPTGAERMANLPTRKGWMEGPPFGGGEYEFWYHCKKTSDLNEALAVFSEIRAPELKLNVHPEPRKGVLAASPETRFDFTFKVWVPRNWYRLFGNPRNYSEMWGEFHEGVSWFRKPVPAPTVDVYLDGGPIEWERVVIPKNVAVCDERESGVPRLVAIVIDVYDLATGKVIPDASVALIDASYKAGADEIGVLASGRCDENGRFTFVSMARMDPKIWASAEGYLTRETRFEFQEGSPEQKFSVALSKTQPLAGVVTNEQGKPLPGVTLKPHNTLGLDSYGYSSEATATTKEDGTFEIALAEGYTELRIRAPGYYYHTAELFRVPSTDLSIVMVGTGTIRGRVVDADGREPERETHISVEQVGARNGRWGGSSRCGDGGRFEFENVPAGEYRLGTRLHLFGEGESDPSAKTVTVRPGETVDVEIRNSFR